MRLSSLTEQMFVIPVEDAIFDVAFIAAENSPAGGKPVKVKPKRAFDLVLAQSMELRLHCGRPLPQTRPTSAILVLKDIRPEIFIPPEIIS